MQEVPPSPVLEALYLEASTRRRTADAKEAEVLEAEAARRTTRKFNEHSASLVDIRLQREVERAFQQHQISGTGLLTKAQLRAALQNLGMLGSKPAAFASSAPRAAAVQSIVLHPSSAQRQSKALESLWHICTTSLASPPSSTLQAAGAASAAHADFQQDANSNVAPEEQNEANSSDSLLDESIDAWQQLLSSVRDPEASQNDSNPSQAFFTGFNKGHADGTARSGPCSRAGHNKSSMQGISLQQLLSFVQLVQQQTSSLSSAAASMPAFRDLSQQQCAELDRLARMCSENKQSNMAYVGIGNRRHVPKGTAVHHHGTGQQASAVQPSHLGRSSSPDGTADSKWHPRSHAGKRQAAMLASNAIRFSRRNHKQQQQQRQQKEKQRGAGQDSASPRPKSSQSELAKTQPFARSASTAAEVVKRRQALAELEMAPCTFHPALDPHSRALVTAMADSYKAPHKTAVPSSHAPPANTMQLSSGGSADNSGQGSLAIPEALPTALLSAEVNRGPLALTSWHIQEQQEFDACTFVPRLNDTSKVKSIVAQRWKRRWSSEQQSADLHDQPPQMHRSSNAAASPTAADSADTIDVRTAPYDQQDNTAQGQNALVDSCANRMADSASKQQQQGVQTNSQCGLNHCIGASRRNRRAAVAGRRGTRQCNSYAAAAHTARQHCRGMGITQPQQQLQPLHDIAISSVERQLQQQQPLQSSTAASVEEQLESAIADCDKQLAQHKAAGLKQPACLEMPVLSGIDPDHIAADCALSAQQHDIETGAEDLQTLQSQLRIGLEALMPDGSAISLEVGQAERLRHLTKLFASMLELSASTASDYMSAAVEAL